MRKLVTVVLSIVAAFALAGCMGAAIPPEQQGMTPEERDLVESLKVQVVQLPDDTSVDCVVLDGVRKGGISCDWERRS